MKTKTIRQSTMIKAGPRAVYEALMDSRKHSAFTGGKAVISRKVGGSFSVYDGYAAGKNLELVPDERIVQSWHSTEWPKGHESIVKFELKKSGRHTRIVFTHTGVPESNYAAIKQGWIDYYWKPLKQMLEKGS